MFSKDIEKWIDEDNLIGSSELPSRCSTGNPIVETSMALIYQKLLGEPAGTLLPRLWSGLMSLKVLPGLFKKKACGNDQITRDDILAICACSRSIDGIIHYQVANYGQNNGWKFENNKEEGASWSASLKPDDIAMVKLMGGITPSLWENLCLYLSVSFSAITSSSTSGLRLKWMCLVAVNGKDRFLDLLGKALILRINKKFSGISGVNLSYYGNKEHPFVRYNPGI